MTAAANRSPVRQLDLETLLPYLDLHLIGATNGVRLFGAAETAWAGSPHAEDFARLRREISEERAFLKRLIKGLGHRPGAVKMTLARMLSAIARMDPLNPARRKDTAGAQLELEALQSLLKGKEALWSTLLAVCPDSEGRPGGPIVDRPVLHQLLDSSRRQQETVARIMTATAPDRFLR